MYTKYFNDLKVCKKEGIKYSINVSQFYNIYVANCNCEEISLSDFSYKSNYI